MSTENEVETEETNLEQEIQDAEPVAQEPVSEEVEVTIGEEKAPEEDATKAPEWVRELRKSHRELQRENKELKAKLTTEPKPVVQLGKKPTLEDFDYDADKFEVALTGWFEKKRQADQEEEARQNEVKTQSQAWQAKLDNYGKLKTDLKAKVKDFDEAEAEVQNHLSVNQQAVILKVAIDPALMVAALGKDLGELKKIAAIQDPLEFSAALARLEGKMKVTPKKPITEPERAITGSGRISGTVDSHLEHLREEAAKTGDFSKVMAYKRQKQSK
jgi:hypothetical protein